MDVFHRLNILLLLKKRAVTLQLYKKKDRVDEDIDEFNLLIHIFTSSYTMSIAFGIAFSSVSVRPYSTNGDDTFSG